MTASDSNQPPSSPDPEAPVEGLKFEHFEVLVNEKGAPVELGRGAMGITYKALDTSLHCFVALKVINAAFLQSDVARQRFLREARSAAGLRHPNVASVFHLGKDGDSFFYAMEFIDGETVEALMTRDGAIAVPLSLEIAGQVCRALMAAENQNLVHRDIKPANLMLVRDETGDLTVKVIDFGLAKSADGTSDATALTLGGFLGTPHFASPEQLEEKPLDIRSDIYSLGVTLWFMLSGKTPFSGSLAQVMSHHLNTAPPIGKLTGIPKPVVDLLERLMAKDPADRPANAAEARKEILAVAGAIEANDLPAPTAVIENEEELATMVESSSQTDMPTLVAEPVTPPDLAQTVTTHVSYTTPSATVENPVPVSIMSPPATQPASPKRNLTPWVLLVIAVLALLAGGVFVFFQKVARVLPPPVAETTESPQTPTAESSPAPTTEPEPTPESVDPSTALLRKAVAMEGDKIGEAMTTYAKGLLEFPQDLGLRENAHRFLKSLLQREPPLTPEELASIQPSLDLVAQGSPLELRASLGQAYSESNPTYAARWIKEAADEKDPPSAFRLAILYYHGRGVDKNMPLAMQWLKTASELGEPRAMSSLGHFYKQGIPDILEANPAEAYRLFSQASELGFLDAQGNLGILIREGLGTGAPPDEKRACELFRDGAERGNPFCMFNFAMCLNEGSGVDQDEATAKSWFIRAAKAGHKGAILWCQENGVSLEEPEIPVPTPQVQ
ncbi:MAG: protein kinase [Terrimicrobiaceae bacterium]